MEYEYKELREELKEALKKALNISQEILQNDYVLGNNLEVNYIDDLFEIPLELLKLIRKI